MTFDALRATFDIDALGAAMYCFAEAAYPLPRSLTGDGVRQTLALLAERVPLEVHEVPTGTPVLDWTVPKEWNVREAWLQDPFGHRVADFAKHNLHLLGYSVPVQRKVPLAELKDHLFSLPDHPDLIPYRTAYYAENWGFCLPHRQLEALPEGEYEVHIDTTLEEGSLTYGEIFLPGETEEEVLLSCHICHPSLANDNLSALAVCTWLAEMLGGVKHRRFGYRFLFAPGTLGAITWLARNEDAARRVRHGLVAANLGDGGEFHYKKSRQGDATIDRVAIAALRDLGREPKVRDFIPFGYDERQYCSPGFNLPVGSLTRTPWGRYPQYHTSADNLDFIQPRALGESLRAYLEVISVLEVDRAYRNLNPKGEPQLGRRGLYRAIGGGEEGRAREMALLWLLNLSDGEHTLLDISERSGIPFRKLEDGAAALLEAGLLGTE
jgi:aminopeptidase-like protein